MFTGIITDIGTIKHIEERGDMRARIACNYEIETIALGASIACDGVCLTVIETGNDQQGNWFDVDISAETLSKTNLELWKANHIDEAADGGRRINLERALKVGDELGGHIVSGHVDGLAVITSMTEEGDSTRVTLRAPKELACFIANKGSVALNGTSLTVNNVDGCDFDINFIPHTKDHTTWGDAKVGQKVNLEIDTLARYVARLNEMLENN